jgi:glutamine amidotransferase
MTVAVVDYGVGNLFSVRRALEQCGAQVAVSAEPEVLLSASRLVLPGVGAFADGMRGLRSDGLDEVVKQFARSGRPLLGICLGMQMLATVSEEFGEHRGLDLIPGRVACLPRADAAGRTYKVPHVGWDDLQPSASWAGTILEDVSPGDAIYSVHSFAVRTEDARHRLAHCVYNGIEVSSAIARDNVFGVQFHPEKSGAVGLKIISRFARMEAR